MQISIIKLSLFTVSWINKQEVGFILTRFIFSLRFFGLFDIIQINIIEVEKLGILIR